MRRVKHNDRSTCGAGPGRTREPRVLRTGDNPAVRGVRADVPRKFAGPTNLWVLRLCPPDGGAVVCVVCRVRFLLKVVGVGPLCVAPAGAVG